MFMLKNKIQMKMKKYGCNLCFSRENMAYNFTYKSYF